MQIFVKIAKGRTTVCCHGVRAPRFTTITLDVEANDTILTVKAKIQGITDITPNNQTLMFMGETLENVRTLADYDILKGATLRLDREWADLTLNVETYDGQQIVVDDITAPDRIVVIKIRIEQQTGIPRNQQRLIFRELELDEDLTLADYNVQNGATIYQLMRLALALSVDL